MQRYRIEQNHRRQDALDGAKPLEVVFSDSRKEATKEMLRLADGGRYYAAVYIGRDGECVEESSAK